MEKVIAKLLLFIGALILKANGQSPVVSPATIMTGGQYTITCDINKISTQRTVAFIDSLKIFRQTTDAQTSTVAQYFSLAPATFNTTRNIPPGLTSTWNFTFEGANGGSNNKDSMRITVNVQNAQCNDAAAFLCSVGYFYLGQTPGQESVNSNQQNLTVEAATTIDPIGVMPAIMGDVTGEYVYLEGDNVTLTCTVRGPVAVILSWELYIKDTQGGNDQLSSLPSNAQITSPPGTPTGGSGSCGSYNYMSTLMFQLDAQTAINTNIFVCVAKKSQADLARANVTISTSGSGTPAPQTSNPASADVGMIVGIVIGCVALIAIIIVVIFVVRYRRNKSRGDTYKDNEDQRDSAADNNLSAPPPVVYPYSKPTKGNKEKDEHKISAGETNEGLDNSYDSRDSTTRGPPRYANTEIENPEPPRYETHRGRQNRAYDDEEREKTDRKHRDDSHEDRKHRSRGHNEPSRRRNYSTDDGNVDFGDPNMGTSI